MFTELKFVMGAVAKKDFVPQMKHFAIENGIVRSYNGLIALSSPIDFDIDCRPKAIPLVKAIQNCDETLQMSMMANGKLRIRSGPVEYKIECDQSDVLPHVSPEGDVVEVDGEKFLEAIKIIEPFICDDANHQFSNGVLFSGQSLYATNNTCLIQYWVGRTFPTVVNVPKQAITEIIRINQPFISVQIHENSITFHYPDGRWIRSGLFSTQWPKFDHILDVQCKPSAINDALFEGIEKLKHTADKQGRIYFKENKICTHEDENEGGSFTIEGFNHNGIYAMEMLLCLKGVAETADFNLYPGACPFFGKNLRGAIIGRKQ